MCAFTGFIDYPLLQLMEVHPFRIDQKRLTPVFIHVDVFRPILRAPMAQWIVSVIWLIFYVILCCAIDRYIKNGFYLFSLG